MHVRIFPASRIKHRDLSGSPSEPELSVVKANLTGLYSLTKTTNIKSKINEASISHRCSSCFGIAISQTSTNKKNSNLYNWNDRNNNPVYQSDSLTKKGFTLIFLVQAPPSIVDKMNAAAYKGEYKDTLWVEYTGKTVDQLWEMYAQAQEAKQ